MQVQRINNYPNYNPNFSAIKSIQYNGLFKGLTHRRMGEYRKIIETSLKEIPEFMNYCNKHDVDIILDANNRDGINIALNIVYEKLREGESKNIDEALRKIFSPIEQRVVVEHEFKQEGSSLSYKVINNFVKSFNKDERSSFIDKLANANLAIMNAAASKLYINNPNEPISLIYDKKTLFDSKHKIPLADAIEAQLKTRQNHKKLTT